MKPLRLFCTISIFLCATFTVRAQSLEAVEYERVLFHGASPAEANAALLSRAACLEQLGRYDDALDALDRLRLFAMSADDRLRSNHLRGVAMLRTGNYQGAAGCLDEGFPQDKEASRDAALILASDRRFDESLSLAVSLYPQHSDELQKLFKKAPKARKEGAAMMLSFLPPLGHIYLKDDKWLGTTLASYAGAALTVWQFIEGNYITAILGGGMLLNASYMEHNIATVPQRTQQANQKAMESFLDKLESLLCD